MRRCVTNLAIFLSVVALGVAMAAAVSKSTPTDASPAVQYHRALFEAVDRGDVEAVNRFFADHTVADPLLFVPDERGRPVALEGPRAAAEWIQLWHGDESGSDSSRTVITSCRIVGGDGRPAAIITEFSRSRPAATDRAGSGVDLCMRVDDTSRRRPDERRYRCTTLLTPATSESADSSEGDLEHARICHLHISVATPRRSAE